MDDATKRRFDAIASLRTGLWNNFNERRTYEWKLTLGLWTVAAIFISSFLFSGPPKICDERVRWGGYILAAGAIFLHWSFLRGLSRANATDRKVMRYDENILRSLSGAELSKELDCEITCWSKAREQRFLGDWSYGAQFGITIFLYAAIALLLSSVRLSSPMEEGDVKIPTQVSLPKSK